MKIYNGGSQNVFVSAEQTKGAALWDLMSSVACFLTALEQLTLRWFNKEKTIDWTPRCGYFGLKMYDHGFTTNSWEMLKTQRGSLLSLFVIIIDKWCLQQFIKTATHTRKRFMEWVCVCETERERNRKKIIWETKRRGFYKLNLKNLYFPSILYTQMNTFLGKVSWESEHLLLGKTGKQLLTHNLRQADIKIHLFI